MKNLKLLLGIFVLTLVFSTSSCDDVKEIFQTIPEWAKGDWLATEPESLGVLDPINPIAITITDKKLIVGAGFSELGIEIPGFSEVDVTVATDEAVQFGAYTVTQGEKPDTIEFGFGTVTKTLYLKK